MNLPADWPHDEKQVGHDWIDRARADRIIEVIEGKKTHGIEEAKALQTDELSVPARRLLAEVRRLEANDVDTEQGLALLRGWDAVIAKGSAAAALFELWWTKHLKPALFRRALGDDAPLLAPGDSDAIIDAIERTALLFAEDGAPARDALLQGTLASAVREARALMGDEASSWAWGRLHHGYFPHALGPIAGAKRGEVPDIGPLPIGGSTSTVKFSSYRPQDFRAIDGASFRLIVDLADLDRSLCLNAPGQSGDPRSKHYDRLAPVWAASDYVPMRYTRAAVDSATEFIWRLRPA
jgi:penicillin amidase